MSEIERLLLWYIRAECACAHPGLKWYCPCPRWYKIYSTKCPDLCGPMQRARVFSSLLYQDVMVFDVPEKDPAQPCKKPSPHKARRTPHGDLSPCRLRSSARASARVHGRTIPWASAAAPAARPRLRLPVSCSCRLVRRRRSSPGPVTSSCVWWVGAVTVHLRDVLARIRRHD